MKNGLFLYKTAHFYFIYFLLEEAIDTFLDKSAINKITRAFFTAAYELTFL